MAQKIEVEDCVRPLGLRDAAAQAARANILRAALRVFARYGYEGGSVDKIARAAKTHGRMIFYYFDNKEGLFIAALEEVYHRMEVAEAKLVLDMADPVEALAQVIRFKVDYYRDNPDFIALVNIENLHKGRHIEHSKRTSQLSTHAVGTVAQILASGVEQGLFRPELKAGDVYLLIASVGYLYTSCRYTLTTFLGRPLTTQESLTHWLEFATESVLRTVCVDSGAATRSKAA